MHQPRNSFEIWWKWRKSVHQLQYDQSSFEVPSSCSKHWIHPQPGDIPSFTLHVSPTKKELATVLGQTWEDLKSDRLMPVHIASWTSALLALTVATCSVCLMLCCCKAADKKLININFRTPRFVRTTRATILARRNREHLLSTLSIPPGEGAAVRPPGDRHQPEEVAAGDRRKPTAPATPTGWFLVRAAVEDNHGITRK